MASLGSFSSAGPIRLAITVEDSCFGKACRGRPGIVRRIVTGEGCALGKWPKSAV